MTDEALLVRRLPQEIAPLQSILAESLADTGGEVLPHLIISDYERWTEKAIVGNDSDSQLAQQLLSELEKAIEENPVLDELIAVSFVELLPSRTTEPGQLIYSALGPRMQNMFKTIFDL